MPHPQRPGLIGTFTNPMRKSARHRRKRWLRKLVGYEQLESRKLLATINWGNENGGFWNDPNNWVGGKLPGSTDDAVIPDFAGKTPTITFSTGTHSVKSLSTSENFVITGGTLTATTIRQLGGTFNISAGTLGSTTLSIGTINVTVGATFNDFTINAGATLNVAANATLQVNSSNLNVFGRANWANGSKLTLFQGSGFSELSQLVVNNGGVVTATGTTFAKNGAWHERTLIDVKNGGRLQAFDSVFSVQTVQLAESAVLNTGDWERNSFDTELYMPHRLIARLSADGGGRDNKRFANVFIASGTLASGTLDLRAIGTETTANLRYRFNGDFTIASGARLNVLPGVRTLTVSGSILTISGTADFGNNSRLNLIQDSGFGNASQVIINDGAIVTATGATFTKSGAWSERTLINVRTGGRLQGLESVFAVATVRLAEGAILNSGDWEKNSFDTDLYLAHRLIPLLSAAGGGKDNKRFANIFIAPATLASGTLDLRAIGTETTDNLNYRFNGNFTIASGARLNVFPSVRTWTVSGSVLTVSGTADFRNSSSLTLVQDSGAGSASQVIINDGAQVTATGTTFAKGGSWRERTLIDVKNGGRLQAVESVLAVEAVQLAENAILNSGDWENNSFDTDLYLPHRLIPMLSAAGGGKDNRIFENVFITSATLTSGTLDLRAIGTETRVNLNYRFNGNFTIASGARLNVLPGVRTWTVSGSVITVSGTADFGNGSSMTLVQNSGAGSASQVIINGGAQVIATGTTFAQGGSWSERTLIDVKNGGRLQAVESVLVVGAVQLAENAILNSGDWEKNRFDTNLYLPHRLIPMLSAAGGGKDNRRFANIFIASGTLSSSALDLHNIGTETTANLNYRFNGSFTVASGASLYTSPNVRTWTVSGSVLTISGIAHFDRGSTLTLVQNSGAGLASQVIVNAGARLISAAATFNKSGSWSERTLIDVKNGGQLQAFESVFAVETVQLAEEAILRASDWQDNSFDTNLYLPHRLIGMLSAVGGGYDNKRFANIYITSGTLAQGTLDLQAIGTETTANLNYRFNGNFTIGSNAQLKVAPSVRTWTVSGSILTVSGDAIFGGNSSLTLVQTSGAGNASQVIVNDGGMVAANGTTFAKSGSWSERTLIDVKNGGQLQAYESVFAVETVQLAENAIANSGDWENNSFDTNLYLPHRLIPILSEASGGKDNRRFANVFINSGNLATGSLDLLPIGTQTTANLNFRFNGNFTVSRGATLNVFPNIRTWTTSGTTLTISGIANFDSNASLTLAQTTGSGNASQLVVQDGARVRTKGTTLGKSGSWSERTLIDVKNLGQLEAIDTSVDVGGFSFGPNSLVTFTQSGGNQFFMADTATPLENYRSIDLNLGASLTLTEPLVVGSANSFKLSYSSSLVLSQNLSGGTRTPANFLPQGRVLLNRGVINNAQLIEVMGADVGALSSGFVNNFAYGKLELSSNTFARLTNASSNWTDGRPEAMYVHTLIVGPGAKLDLNGQKLYVRAFQNAGTIVNGSVAATPILVADGGPLAFATPTPGAIETGTIDTWTFTASQNAPVMIQVNPGGSGITAAVTPLLQRARVELLDANDTLLKSIENDGNGNLVTLTSDALTSGQNYKIRVRAHSGFATSAGNYVITLLNANSLETALSISADSASSSKLEGNSGTTTYTFNVTRFGDVSGSLSVDWSVTGSGTAPASASDFEGGVFPSGTVTFANASEITKSITIKVNADTTAEKNESFTVSLSNPSSAVSFTQQSATSLIINDDQPSNADLVVSAIVQPVGALSGQRVTLGWTEKNIGAASAVGLWATSVRVVHRGTGRVVYDQASTFVNNALAPDTSVDRSVEFDLPNGVPGEGPYDVTIRVDAFGDITEANLNETGESNNVTLESFTAGPGLYPDLVLDTIDAPTNVQLNTSFNISWVVFNNGPAPLNKPVRERVYLSQDNKIDADDRVLLTVDNAAKLPLGIAASYTQQATITLPLDPALLPGDYQLLIATDIDDTQFELSETNNTRAHSLVISAPSLPDLVVTDIQAQSLAVAGQNILVTWVIKNQGRERLDGPWTDRLYLSDDGLVGNDRTIESYPINTQLLPDGSIERTQLVAIPSNLSGVYRFVVTTDVANQVEEFDREDNNSTIDDVIITIDPRPSANLVVNSVVSLTNGLSSGQSATVEWVVNNIGNASTNSAAWEDRLYLSLDAIFGPEDVLLGKVANVSYLNASESYRSSLSVTLPQDAVGERYFIVVTDATNRVSETAGEQDNSKASARTNIELTPPPDLLVTIVQSPRDAVEDQPIIVSWTVKNSGTGPTRVSQWDDQVYLSLNNRRIDAGDRLLKTVTHSGVLAVGEQYSVDRLSILLPENVAASEAFIIVRTDARDVVYEFVAEDNNDTVAENATNIVGRPRPDLTVTEVRAPANAVAGQPLNLSYTVSNRTPNATWQSNWQETIYLSTDETLDPQSDTVLEVRTHTGGLSGEQSSTKTARPKLPDTLAGDYFIIVVTDSAQQVVETLDNNNSLASSKVKVVVDPPDLKPVTLTPSANLAAGREFSVSYTVSNIGNNPTPVESWNDALYLSSDDQLDASDLLLSERQRTGLLAPGSSEARSMNVRLPGERVGNAFLILHSDSRDNVFELNQQNNLLATAIAIGDNRPDLNVTVFRPQLEGRQFRPGGTISMDFEVANQGLGPTFGISWTDRLVLSADLILGNADDVWLKDFSRVQELSRGQSYSRRSENVVIPSGTAEGMYRLFMVTDARGQIAEGNESNNSVMSADFVISNTPGSTQTSDLSIVNLSVPTDLVSGQNLAIGWTTRNISNFATSSRVWFDDVWLSVDQAIDSSDTFIGRYAHEGALGTTQQYVRSINYPVGIDVSGSYFVIVATDTTNRELEENEDNNKRVSARPISITLGPTPDLQVAAITAPPQAFSGRTVSLGWEVTNSGADSRAAFWTDRVFLSLDKVLDPASDIPLGYVDHLPAQPDSYTVTNNFLIPAGVGGSFYVIVATDSTNRVYERASENNNVRVSDQVISVAHLPPADLVVGDITIPANGQSGQVASIRFTVSNQGQFGARAGWFDTIYLSSDDRWDIDDALFGRVEHREDLPAGGSYTTEHSAPLPGVVPGDYRVIIRSDIRNNLVEDNEDNNLKATLNAFAMDASALVLGVAQSGMLTEGRSAYYKVTVPAGETVAIEFDSLATAGMTEMYASFGKMPRRSQADHVALDPFQQDQRIVISSTEGGTYYILVFGQAIAGGSSDYSIMARIVPFTVFDTSYGQGGTAGNRTIEVHGAKFDRSVTAELVDSSGQIAATAIRYYRMSDTRLFVTFDLQTVQRGTYSVRFTKPSSNEVVIVPNSLQVVFATLGEAPLSLSRPDAFNRLRDDRPPAIIPVTLGWRNTTLNDLPVPLIHFSATDPFATTLEAAKDGKTIDAFEFLGFPDIDGPRDILIPGQYVSTPFYIKPRQVTPDTPPIDIHYVAEYFYETDDANYVWDFDLSQLDLTYLSDDEAIATIAAFKQSIGSSIGSYRQALVQAMQRAGNLTPRELGAANRYLLQEVFDRFVASRQTSLSGVAVHPSLRIDLSQLVVNLVEVSGSRSYWAQVQEDGSFVFPSLPAAEYQVRITGGAVKAPDGLRVQVGAGQSAQLTIQLIDADKTAADALPTRSPVGTSPVSAPMLTRAGQPDEVITGNVLEGVSSQLTGITHRVELIGDAPQGFVLESDGTYQFSSSEPTAFVVHYDLVLPDSATRVGRLFNSEIRSRGALAITLENNVTRDIRSQDPNDIIGPAGVGDLKWVSKEDRLPYEIRFENEADNEARGPAQLVRIVQTLDSDLDASTVHFGNFAFGGREFEVPPKTQTINQDIDLRAEMGIWVRVFAIVNPAKNEISWTFSSISPATNSETNDPNQGFLPLNDKPPKGEGFVKYSVKPSLSAVNGARIDALARIIFDGNNPIDTPSIFNTLDATSPTSTVSSKEIPNSSHKLVHWEGVDGDVGSGLDRFDVYVSINDGRYQIWLGNTPLVEAEYATLPNTSYNFITLARDRVGNVESATKIPDALRPIALPSGPYTFQEGVIGKLSGRGQDVDGDTTSFLYEWDLNYDGTSFHIDSTSPSPELTLGNGPIQRTVGLRVRSTGTDSLYSLIATTVIEVANVAPQLTKQASSVSALVNMPMQNSGNWSDVQSDVVTLSASFGTVTKNADGTWSWTYVPGQPLSDETITITATDQDQGTSTISFTATATYNTQTFQPVLSTTQPALTNSRNYVLSVDFLSPVIDFASDDLQLLNGTVTSIIDLGGGKFTLNIQAVAFGEVSVSLPAERVVDGEGRRNSASNEIRWRWVDTSNLDFGDAPASSDSQFAHSYPTRLSENGARHALSNLWLGASVDADSDGQPSADSLGDDNQGGTDDEDGIVFATPLLSSSQQATLASFVAHVSLDGKLDAWIDFNRDGDWLDVGEQITISRPVTQGSNLLAFTIPQGASPGPTYARFRLSSSGGLTSLGSAPDGEVEDYLVELQASDTPTDLVIQQTSLEAHQVRVVGDQLQVTHDSTIYFQALATSIRSIQFMARDGVTSLYTITNPAVNLFGTLIVPTGGSPIAIQSLQSTINLTGLNRSIVGIQSINLTNPLDQQLIVNEQAILDLNSQGKLRVVSGDTDTVSLQTAWNYTSSQMTSGKLIHQFQTEARQAILELEHFRPWHNALLSVDVNGSGSVEPLDVLLIINLLNKNAGLPAYDPTQPDRFDFADTNGDGVLSPIDALLIINHINTQGAGEGESPANTLTRPPANLVDAVFDQFTDIEALKRNRKR